ncbi:MAG: zinc-ribbon domain-containing protein, partial [Chloroflexi bacterium]|nr:zinc-ribbon domain-containing protein [Chloroflexota bacterium]
MNCTHCQTPNPDTAKFCMNCGLALALICPECRTELPSAAKFCFNCGHRFGGPLRQAPDAPVRQAQDAPPPAQSPLRQFIPPELIAKLESARASGGMAGERRVVTMLFCDVKGSTAAAGQLDPEEWAEIMNGAFKHLIAPVYHYEGTLARLMGDAILAFFGAPIAHEDDPQRAVRAALEIIQSIRPYCQEVKRRWHLDFDVRVGINTGLVVVGAVGSDLRLEYTAMGDAINLASRMEQTAQPGTVQISADTYRLVAPLFECVELGGIEVKGKPEPVRAYRVVAPKLMPGDFRRGPSPGSGPDLPLVGR